MLANKTAKISLNGDVYEVKLLPDSDPKNFSANLGGASVSDPSILAKLYASTRALLFVKQFSSRAGLDDVVQSSLDLSSAINELYNATATANFAASLAGTGIGIYLGRGVSAPNPVLIESLLKDTITGLVDIKITDLKFAVIDANIQTTASECPSGDFVNRESRLADLGLRGWNRL